MPRITEYDGLRGWLLIVIACNHLYGGFVSNFTRAPLGYISAAEGFVFLSGFVAYFVYRQLDYSPMIQTKKILQRAFTIYGFHITAIALTFALVEFFPLYQAIWKDFFLASNFFSSPLQFSLASLLLLEHPGYHDILIMYLVAMAFLPLALAALRKERWFLVLTMSLILWFIAPFIELSMFNDLYSSFFPALSMQVSTFDPLAWQLYFYLGVLISYVKLNHSDRLQFPYLIIWFIFISAGGLMLAKHLQLEWLVALTGNSGNAPFLTVINLLLLCFVFKWLMQQYPKLFTLSYPVFLGRHALPVFSFHTVVVYFLLPFTYEWINKNWYWDVLVCAFFIALLSVPAKLDQLYRNHKRESQLADSINHTK